jgi:predicted RNase H-like HicB family nuclease
LPGRRGGVIGKRLAAVITKEDKWYVARCIEPEVVSRGKTIEEAQANLKEKVELYLVSFGSEDIPESAGEVVLFPFGESRAG